MSKIIDYIKDIFKREESKERTARNYEMIENDSSFVVKEGYLDYERTDEEELKRKVTYWETLPDSQIKLAYLVDYRSMGTRFATQKEWEARHMVWNYKYSNSKVTPQKHEEILNFVVPKFEKLLTETFGDDLSKLTLLCIPASTPEADQKRNESFSQMLCERTHMTNAYGHIKIVKEKTPAKNGGQRMNADMVKELYEYDVEFFKGKNIVLCDDVVSTGSSLMQFKSKLESYGANIVCAIAVGRTIKEFKSKNMAEIKHEVPHLSL